MYKRNNIFLSWTEHYAFLINDARNKELNTSVGDVITRPRRDYVMRNLVFNFHRVLNFVE